MSTRLYLVMAVVIANLALFPAGTPAGPRDASTPPQASGPLVGLTFPCQDHGRSRARGVSGQSCSWSFELAGDTDPADDYGAYWLQMEIDPGEGWCAKRLRFDFSSDDARVLSAVPESGTSGRARPSRPHLVVDAAGHSGPAGPGSVVQEVLLPAGTVESETAPHRYRYAWTGSSQSKVVVAVGLELAHAAGFAWDASHGVRFAAGPCRQSIAGRDSRAGR